VESSGSVVGCWEMCGKYMCLQMSTVEREGSLAT